MREKPRLHFHSDCEFFAGCENMLANFFCDKSFVEKFEVSFSCRYSEKYLEGFRARAGTGVTLCALPLFDVSLLQVTIDRLAGRVAGVVIRALFLVVFLRQFALLWNVFILFLHFRKSRIDVLHVNNGGYPGASSCQAAVLAASLSGVRNIVYVVNNLARGYGSPSRWPDFLVDQMISKRTSAFVSGSRAASDRLMRVLGISPEKARSIPNGIARRTIIEERTTLRTRLGINEETVVVGCVALLVKRKGHEVLIRAFGEVVQLLGERAPILIIEGVGPEEKVLKDKVAGAGIGSKVLFVGNADRVFDLMNAFDIFVLPSIEGEDLPNVILEAMSLGLPIIGSCLAGIPEQIIEGKTGLLVEPRDAKGLAAAILTLVENPSQRREFGANGLTRFEEEFGSAKAVEKYEKVYCELLGGVTL